MSKRDISTMLHDAEIIGGNYLHDVKALVARLAEAERLLRDARSAVQYHHDCAEIEDCVIEQAECIERLARIDAFLAPDSA